MTEPELPVPVLSMPHWRMNIRPQRYEKRRIASPEECWEIAAAASVRLRGWDYPHMPSKSEYKVSGDDWVGSWVSFMDHIEYWRLYQSAQFLHLHAVREAQNPEWTRQLLSRVSDTIQRDGQVYSARGALSVENILYTLSEIFEFAARMAQRDLFDEALRLDIAITGIRHFALVADFGRAWDGGYYARQNTSRRSWELATAELVARSAEISLEATGWFFHECGFESSIDVFKPEQARFLAGLR